MRRNLLPLFLFVCLLLQPVAALAEISRNVYHTIIDVVERSYQPIFSKHNLRLRILRQWSDSYEQASAWHEEDRQGEVAVLHLPGGLARQPIINADAYTLVVCHEIGHHLAGPPRVWKYSVEGQADYFGVAECLRRVLPRLPENSTVREATTPDIVADSCWLTYADNEARSLCVRSAMAGARLSSYFAHKRHLGPPAFDQPDIAMTDRVMIQPPSPQCRLDTYFAAALCDPERSNPTTGNAAWLCTRHPLQNRGQRPRCWFSAQDGGGR